MPPLTHAKLTASGAHRWMNCPGSIPLGKLYPNESSEFAEEGSLAHALAELTIKRDVLGEEVDLTTLEQEVTAFYDTHPGLGASLSDMKYYVKQYVDYVDEWYLTTVPQHALFLEQKFDLSDYIPEGFGTGDTTIIRGKTLHIVDLKYGKGVEVKAPENPQLMIYALGAYTNIAVPYEFQIDTIQMTIYQPRLNNVSTWELPLSELKKWGREVLRPAAKIAFSEREQFAAGEWCRFCPARAQCKYRAQHVLQLEAFLDKHTLNPTEIAHILDIAKDLSTFVDNIKATAVSTAEAGTVIPGYKLVAANTKSRWGDSKAVEEYLLSAGYDKSDFMTEGLVGIRAIQKLVDKETFGVLAKYITKPQGNPTIAPIDDKREELPTLPVEPPFEFVEKPKTKE